LKNLKYFILAFLLFLVLIAGLLVHGYYANHIQIDSKYTLVDDKSGFGLINNSGKVLVGNPIVWYCDTKDYIIGCTGEDISNKTESYIPKCISTEHFILDKNSSKVINSLSEKKLNNFIRKNNIKCHKHYMYSK